MLGGAGTLQRSGCSAPEEALLLAFIQGAAEANIISGVQVKLMNEFAVQWCAAGSGSQQQQAADAGAQPGRQAAEQREAPLEPAAPQLSIQPLNLPAGLADAAGCNGLLSHGDGTAAGAATDAATASAGASGDAATDGNLTHTAALMAQLAAGSSCLYNQPAEPCCPAPAGLMVSGQELLQALGYAATDAIAAAPTASTSATPAPADTSSAAAAGSAAVSSKAAGARKQRFSREQHAAILESVERNFAQYPSRYTELVIKEMQALFPGIELNNACVRKIKFRANDASKQQPAPQLQAAALPDHQAAADAAHGLVGLASAAAAAAATAAAVEALTHLSGMPQEALQLQCPAAAAAAGPEPAVCGQVAVKTEPGVSAGCPHLAAEDTAAAAAAAAGWLQARCSDSPYISEPAGAEAVKQHLQQDAAFPQTAAAADCRAGSSPPDSSALRVQLPEAAVAGATAAAGEDCVDSATAAAAEAMHLLAAVSSEQHQQHQDAGAGDAVAAAPASAGGACEAGSIAAASAAGVAASGPSSSKRKRDSQAGSAAGDATASGIATSSPVRGPVAEALSAAADLVGGLTQQQDAAADLLTAACNPAAHDQQQQQQSLLQHFLQLHQQQQQQQQPAWDVLYSSRMAQLQQQLQVAGAGLGSSGSVAALQLQVPPALLQGSTAAAAAAAAAAGAGQPPAAKRQRLSGAQMAELIASVKHHVQVNPERYTHCVIKDMKDKYPDLELNMGQIRKIKFRTLGNANNSKQPAKAGAESEPGGGAEAAAAAAAGACSSGPGAAGR